MFDPWVGTTRAGGKPWLLRGPLEADTPPHSQLWGRRLVPLGSWHSFGHQLAIQRPGGSLMLPWLYRNDTHPLTTHMET